MVITAGWCVNLSERVLTALLIDPTSLVMKKIHAVAYGSAKNYGNRGAIG